MIVLGEGILGLGDWVAFVGLAIGQTVALGTILWRAASRLQNIESKVDMLITSEIANLKGRLDRLERLSDEA